MNLINEVDKPTVKKIIVIYSGRFQPFHRGHYASYQKLVSKFGKDNVYIGTSNDTSGPKSPFNFKEKKQVATTMFGIPSNRFVQIQNPYQPIEILKKFDGKTTQYIAAVGEKDATRLHGKYFKPYKGKPGYGYDEIGYVYAVPAEPNPISGTDVRKGLGSGNAETKKKFFLKAYPKMDKDIFKMITTKIGKLNEAGPLQGAGMAVDFGPNPLSHKKDDEKDGVTEDGFPGGVFTGLVSPGGYINGAPQPKDVAKLSKKIHKKDNTKTNKDYVYDPISEIIHKILFEEEAPNTVMDKEISYKATDGSEKKITVRNALRLSKDHPAHIQAKKLTGKEEPKAEKPKEKGEKDSKKGAKEIPAENPKATEPKGPAPIKLSGAELKSDAEKSPEEKHQEKSKMELDSKMKEVSPEDVKAGKEMNDTNSPERQEMKKNSQNWLSKMGNKMWEGAKKWGNEKKEMLAGTGAAIKTLASGGKVGSIKGTDGKWVHHTDFKIKSEELDTKTGKNKTVWKDKSDLTPEQQSLKKKSEHEDHKQRHALKHTAKDVGLLALSMVGAGAIGGAIGGMVTHGAAGIVHGAAHGITSIIGHGAAGFGTHVAKDIAKHSAFEAMGLGGHHAAGATAAMGAIGHLLEGDDEQEGQSHEKFVDTLLKKTIQIMMDKTLSDEQMLRAVETYQKESGDTNLKSLAKTIDESAISKSKVQNIADFVGYATKKLKLKDKPKIKLILGQDYSKQNSTLGGYSPDTKDIVVVIPNRMTADICRTIGHELVHRKQDELGLIKNSNTAGTTGSPIENQANSVAGILLRDYGKINKEIYSEGKILLDETSYMSTDGDDQPNGAWLPKGAQRVLGADDGVNKSDYWFHNGGYIQLEFPEADKILGDEDENQIYVQYITKNVPRQSGPKTVFNKNPEKAKIISEMGKGDIHFKNIFQHWRDGDAKLKQKIANLVTGNKYAKSKEIVKNLLDLDITDIEWVEDEIGITLFETIKKVGSKYVVYPKKGGKRLGTHDSLVSAKKQLSAIEINKEDINVNVNPGDVVLMGKFKNKRVKIKDIGEDPHGMPTINGKQATTFRKVNEVSLLDKWIDDNIETYLKEGNFVALSFGEDQSFRSPYLKKWEEWDMCGKALADIIGFEVYGHTSESFKEKGEGKVLPTNNPTEENGPGKRWMHPSKPKEYAEDKKVKWEMYPFNSRPAAYQPPPDIGTQVDVFKYDKPSVIKENIQEWNQLLLEGGAYGHMSHPFDDMDLTFGQLKDIITRALDGNLGVVREKTDGQALAISWKKGRLIAARNKGHLENAGANAMGINDVASKFQGRGGLTDAYNYAMQDLNAAISGLSKGQRDKIFNEGKCFMNIEVIWPTSVNVIPYGQALLIFHNTTCYDEKGTAIGADQSAARTLAGMIKQVNADVQSKYTIQGPPITSIPKNEDLSSLKGGYLSKLSKLQNEFGCNDSDTMAVYHQLWWENFINKKAPAKVDKITKDALIRRWAFGDKSFRLNTISNPELQKWAIQNDKVNVQKQQKDNMRPFEEIFLGVGADVLSFVSSVLTVHPDKAIRNMKDRLKSTADQVRKAGSPAQIQKLKSELERLNNLGGVDKIVASEGLVFFYGGKTYKLTGTFAPLNKIINIFW
jgi:hypothetical protein